MTPTSEMRGRKGRDEWFGAHTVSQLQNAGWKAESLDWACVFQISTQNPYLWCWMRSMLKLKQTHKQPTDLWKLTL